MKIHCRKLNKIDYLNMRSLLIRDGVNNWNYITEESISTQFSLIDEGKHQLFWLKIMRAKL